MEHLYAPWRTKYTTDKERDKSDDAPKGKCPFCHKLEQSNDEKNFILKRYKHCVVIMNLYPYNAGHLMVIPLKHIGVIAELSDEERNELMSLTSKSVELLKKTFGAEGCNIGMNLGKAAGAGIPSHMHMHVVPRWNGDTNFLPLIAETKSISLDLNEIYKKLKENI